VSSFETSERKFATPDYGAARRSNARSPGLIDLFLRRMSALEGSVAGELARPAEASSALGAAFLDVAREAWLLGSASVSGVASQLGFLAPPALHAGQTDEFGVDHEAAERMREWVRPIARGWLGLRDSADKRPPERGGVLVVCSRSAWPLATEALVVHAALADRYAAGRPAYVLWDGGAPELPWVSDTARRLGILAATAENARHLLERGAFVLAFPEGRAACEKTYEKRYRVTRFAGGDLIGAAMNAGAAIIPAAVVGNEESYPLLACPGGFPLTLQFPATGLLGLAPLPLAWSVRLGAQVSYARDEQDDMQDSDAVVDAVRERIQAMLAEMLAARRSLVYG
jgi:hypothetical protein